MNKIMLNILSLTVLLVLTDCRKEVSNSETDVPKNPIIWSFDTEIKGGLTMNNFIYKKMIIQGHETGINTSKIWALSIETGEIIWETDILPLKIPISPEDSDVKDNYLAMEGNGKLYVIDLENGQTVWNYIDPFSQNAAGLSIIGDFIYFSISYSRLLQFEIKTGTSKTIISLNKDDLDNYRPRLTAPTYWKHPSGDEILILGNRSYNGSVSNFDRYDFLAYNLTADSMLWYRKGVPGIRGSISTPLVLNNKVVYYLSRNVECVNPLNGETIWNHSRHLADNYSAYKTGNITYWNNIVIAKPDSDYMYGININTGDEVWFNPKTASMPNTIRIEMNKIWYSSGGVNCFDAKTGKTLINKWRYQNKGSWINPIAVDEKTGYIYTTADGVIYCLDANMLMEK